MVSLSPRTTQPNHTLAFGSRTTDPIEYQGKRVLLPGDLERPGLNDLLAEEPWHCDVLLAPHHGSQRSDAPGLAQWASPTTVVISGGPGIDVRPTAAAYRKLGAEVVHTGEVGAIAIRIAHDRLEIRPSTER